MCRGGTATTANAATEGTTRTSKIRLPQHLDLGGRKAGQVRVAAHQDLAAHAGQAHVPCRSPSRAALTTSSADRSVIRQFLQREKGSGNCCRNLGPKYVATAIATPAAQSHHSDGPTTANNLSSPKACQSRNFPGSLRTVQMAPRSTWSVGMLPRLAFALGALPSFAQAIVLTATPSCGAAWTPEADKVASWARISEAQGVLIVGSEIVARLTFAGGRIDMVSREHPLHRLPGTMVKRDKDLALLNINAHFRIDSSCILSVRGRVQEISDPRLIDQATAFELLGNAIDADAADDPERVAHLA